VRGTQETEIWNFHSSDDMQDKVKSIPEFFDIDGLVHHESIPPGQSVNGHSYVQALHRLCHAVWRKQRDKRKGKWFPHHDNTPSHTQLVVEQFLIEKAFLSTPTYCIHSEQLSVVPKSENWPQGDTFHNHGETSFWCNGGNTGRFQKKANGRNDGTSELGGWGGGGGSDNYQNFPTLIQRIRWKYW
jgi:hypothetical protein